MFLNIYFQDPKIPVKELETFKNSLFPIQGRFFMIEGPLK